MAKRTLVKICFSPRRGASFSHAKRRQKRPRGTKRPQNGTNMNPRDPKMPPEGPKMASRGANGIWRLPLPSWLPAGSPPYPGKATPALTPLNLSRDSAEILQKLIRTSSESQKLFKVSFRNSSDMQKLFRNSLRNSHAGSADLWARRPREDPERFRDSPERPQDGPKITPRRFQEGPKFS